VGIPARRDSASHASGINALKLPIRIMLGEYGPRNGTSMSVERACTIACQLSRLRHFDGRPPHSGRPHLSYTGGVGRGVKCGQFGERPSEIRRDDMATFISTVRFTQQGIKEVRETTKRAAALSTAAKKLGVKVTNIYWTLGTNDGLAVLEAPDAEAVTALMLQLGAEGNVHTTTVRAFTPAEMDRILEKMSGRGKS
jgi:uncharacterized protein with GYD domain